MHKTYFHNSKITKENESKKKTLQDSSVDTKGIVDINILLNRVKIEERNQIKRKIILFSLVTVALSLFGAFIVIVK